MRRGAGNRRRSGVAACLGAAIAAVGMFTPAAAQTAPGDGRVGASVTQPSAVAAAAAGFTDVPPGSTFAADIEWLATRGITAGFEQPDGSLQFRPAQAVTRQAMAAFLFRLAGSPAHTPPATSPFVDVPTSSPFYREIAWLASEGISMGSDLGDGTVAFAPAAPVSRQAMAAFLYRFARADAYLGPDASPFVDVPPSHIFYDEIAWLAEVGVSTGTDLGGSQREYGTVRAVSRQAMAAFMHRLDALLDGPVVTAPAARAGYAGLAYLQPLTVTGGTAPYTWSADGLPAGLSISPQGVIEGTPTAQGESSVTVRATDAEGRTGETTTTVSVTGAMPDACLEAACALMTPNGRTREIPASRIGGVTTDDAGALSSVVISGDAPVAGDILVLAPTEAVPTGVVVLVEAVTGRGDGTSLVEVGPAGFADAYAEGVIKTDAGEGVAAVELLPGAGSMPGPNDTDLSAARTPAHKDPTLDAHAEEAPTSGALAMATLACDNGVSSDLRGLSVEPSLTPNVAAIWKHPVFNAGGLYFGFGGLELFQFALDGTVTVNLGVNVSGASTCTLSLPTLRSAVPAGPTGAVVLELEPTVILDVSGTVDVRGSVTLTCGAVYRWVDGVESSTEFCRAQTAPFALSADSGVTVSVAGALDTLVSWNRMAGVTGNITGTVTAAYRPVATPVASLRAKAEFDLGACLACFWNGSPARLTIVSGTIFDREIARWDTSPPRVPSSSPPHISTTSLPRATVGVPYSQALTTSDDREGFWEVESGALPAGLSLDGDTIVGRPSLAQTATVGILFTDAVGATARRTLTLAVGTETGPGGAEGAVQALDHCRQTVLERNDDESSAAVPLPFDVYFGGVTHSSLHVSNNGYVTFGEGEGDFTPYPLDTAWRPIIAPFFADVDTRDPASAMVTYGVSADGRSFCANWVDVGYYNRHVDKTNSFQLILTARPDTGAGNVDITFNYGHLTWETGDASGGTGGVGGTAARAGYSALDGTTSFELPGSGQVAALVDGGTHALVRGSSGSDVPGRYVFPIRGD